MICNHIPNGLSNFHVSERIIMAGKFLIHVVAFQTTLLGRRNLTNTPKSKRVSHWDESARAFPRQLALWQALATFFLRNPGVGPSVQPLKTSCRVPTVVAAIKADSYYVAPHDISREIYVHCPGSSPASQTFLKLANA